VGILDNDHSIAAGFNPRHGDRIEFGPEHIISIDVPPRDYIEQRFGIPFSEE
jgi:hypothetical protein